jgi:glycerol uptake facilitator-like aquaporin
MQKPLLRTYLMEGLCTFALVYFGAGTVCVNHMTTPRNEQPEAASLTGHQPGLVGLALAQGLIFGLMLEASLAASGGCLNTGITIMLWVFNRFDSAKAFWLIVAQLLGAFLAGGLVYATFEPAVLQSAHAGTPHVSALVYPSLDRSTLLTGTSVELVLTFFLVFAIFGIAREGSRPGWAGVAGGVTLTAAVMLGYTLTGGCTNPARWLGTVFWEKLAIEDAPGPGPLADIFVYVAGPILGALTAGFFSIKLLAVSPEQAEHADRTVEPGRGTQTRARK